MKWSWKLGEVAGIGIYVHATFFIIVGWIALHSWLGGESAAAVAAGVLFLLALFACVVLHELGHALAARRYHIRTRDITLLPIGGVARLERMPEDPKQELVVALAGPAVNLVLAALLVAGLWLTRSFDAEVGISAMEGPTLQRLAVVNVFLMGFNLLPAFPMDGGRALRAVLATRMSYVDATQVAANIGQAMALAFGFIGLIANPFLLFIALFVWIGAAAEASMVQMKSALAGIPVAQAMITQFDTLELDDPLARAVELTLRGSQKDFPVVERGQIRGVLTQDRLVATLAKEGQSATVGQVMEKDRVEADSHEMLDGVLAKLDGSGCKLVPVTHAGQLVGLVNLDNVSEWIRIQSALQGRRAGPGPALGAG